MMKILLLTLALAGLSVKLSGQVFDRKIFPDPGFAQCPDVDIKYYVYPWSVGCPTTVTVTGGEVLKQEVYNGKLEVTIRWQEPADSISLGRIAIEWPDSLCSYGIDRFHWDYRIISHALYRPFVTGVEPYFYVGEYNYINLQASMDLTGLGNGAGIPSSQFEWDVPPAWSNYAYGPANEQLYVNIVPTNALLQGCIRVRGRYPCGSWSDWADFCLHGTMRSPCPISLSGDPVLLCGDTANRIFFTPQVILPHSPSYPWTNTAYTWTVPPNWTIVGANPTSENFITIRPDGYTGGEVSVVARAGDFTSPVCTYPVKVASDPPGMQINGPDYVCTEGKFNLTPAAPAVSDVLWAVTPIDPATPAVVVPDHGSGPAVFQIGDPDVSGYFRLHYTVSNACGAVERTKEFFVGKPRFEAATLDGTPYSGVPVCVGYHATHSQVEGMSSPAVTWSSTPGITGFTRRDSFVFSLDAPEGARCPVVTARAGNVCGVSDLPLEICPQPGCDLPQFDLSVYPNPTFIIVNLETTAADPVAGANGLIEQVEVINAIGQLVTTWREAPSQRIIKSIVELPNGIYTLRATVWGQVIIKRLVVQRLF